MLKEPGGFATGFLKMTHKTRDNPATYAAVLQTITQDENCCINIPAKKRYTSAHI